MAPVTLTLMTTRRNKAHAGWEGLIGEAVVDAARLGYYMGMGCPTVAVRMLSSYVRAKGQMCTQNYGSQSRPPF